jgi:ribosomal protein S18 acetylase RimI-like enzyme
LGGHDLHRAVIEAAEAADRDGVVGLWHACGLTRPWNDPVADFDRAVANGGAAVLLGRAGGHILGSVMVGFDGHRGWIYYLAVARGHRRQGLGKALMAAAEDWLRARGCPKIQLMVREDNRDALGFYAALGMERQPVVTLGRFLEDIA